MARSPIGHSALPPSTASNEPTSRFRYPTRPATTNLIRPRLGIAGTTGCRAQFADGPVQELTAAIRWAAGGVGYGSSDLIRSLPKVSRVPRVKSIRLSQDCYMSIAGNDYSSEPRR